MTDILPSDLSKNVEEFKHLSTKNLFYFTLTVYMLQTIYCIFIIKQHIFYDTYTMYLVYDETE